MMRVVARINAGNHCALEDAGRFRLGEDEGSKDGLYEERRGGISPEADDLSSVPVPGAVYINRSSSSRSSSLPGITCAERCSPSKMPSSNHAAFPELLSMSTTSRGAPALGLPFVTHASVERTTLSLSEDGVPSLNGLSLVERNGATFVAGVSKSGPYASTELREGCQILAIDGRRVKRPRDVMRGLRRKPRSAEGERVSVILSRGPPSE